MKPPSLFETICDIVRTHDAMEQDSRPIKGIFAEQAALLVKMRPNMPAPDSDCHDDGFYSNKKGEK